MIAARADKQAKSAATKIEVVASDIALANNGPISSENESSNVRTIVEIVPVIEANAITKADVKAAAR